ncbi:uncharacterized protein LOC144792069 [Lissotriton helveticus]
MTSDGSQRPKETFKPKSKFMFPISHKILDNFETLVKKDLESIRYEIPKHSNLSKSEKRILENLRQDKSITFQPADKGGALVMMDTTFYDRKVEEHVQDTLTYIKLEKDPTSEFSALLDKIITKAENDGTININTARYLKTTTPQVPHIYMLPKIHKSLEDPPFRPIVAGCGSIHEPVGRFVDHHLQPLVQSWGTYLKDTTDCLTKLSEVNDLIDDSTLLCTIDVVALYTSIAHMEGLEAIEWRLLESGIDQQLGVFLIELLHFSLFHSYFNWKSDFFLQKTGTSMGFSGAPSYANTFMAYFEQQHILSDHRWMDNLILFLRYIDDILVLWRGTKQELVERIQELNTRNPRIQFTYDVQDSKIHFLDIEIQKTSQGISTTVYRKATDVNNALHYSSAHPRNLKNHLPTSQLMRIKRISSDGEKCEVAIKEQLKRYTDRGYPLQVLEDSELRVRSIDRESLLRKTEKSPSERIVFVMKHSTQSDRIRQILRKRWEMIANEPDFTHIFKNFPIIAYTRAKNIRELLKKPQRNQTVIFKGMRKCHNCGQCNNTIVNKTFAHPQTGKSIILKLSADCNTAGVIYAIQCPCGLTYVGRTSRKIKTRIIEHKSTIRNKSTTSSLATHWSSASHTIP